MHFDEHSCSLSCTFILRAADCRTTLFRAWQSVYNFTAIICALDKTQVIISRVVAAGNVAIVDGDVAVAAGGSGVETRSCGVCRGAVAQPSRVWHHFREAGGSFKAGRAVVVAVVNSIDNVDGGCAGIITGDMAGLWDVVSGGAGCWGPLLACTVVSQVQ